MSPEEIQQEFNKVYLDASQQAYRLSDLEALVASGKAELAEKYSKLRSFAHQLQSIKAASEEPTKAVEVAEVV